MSANSRDFQMDLRLKAEFSDAQKKLREIQKELDGVGKTARKANANMGAAGQGAAMLGAKGADQLGKAAKGANELYFASRQLPMQFTDIATSLATGQRPLNVFLQQGGQLKDLFGGVGPALRAMGGYLVGLINPLTVAAGVVGGLAIAWKQGRDEALAFDRALASTGNTAGTTTEQLIAMSRQLADGTTTQHAAAAALAEVASSGQFTAEQLGVVTQAAIDLEKLGGQAVGDTVKEFTKLREDPVRAIVELNDKLHFLTEATYSQIEALQQQGREQEAATLAMRTYAEAVADRTADVEENLGTLEKAWRALGVGAKFAWDAMLDIGRRDTGAEQFNDLLIKLQELENPSNSASYAHLQGAAREREIERVRAELKKLQDANVEAQKQAGRDAATQRANDLAIALDQEADKYDSAEQKRAQRIIAARQRANDAVAEALRAGNDELAKKIREDEARIIAGIEKEGEKKPKTPKKTEAQKQSEAAARELANLERQVALLGQVADGETKVSEAARIRYEVEQGAFRLADEGLKKQLLAQAARLDADRRQLDLTKQLEAVNLERLKLQGKDGEAAIDALLKKWRELQDELRSSGRAGDAEQVGQAITALQNKAGIDVMQAQAQAAFDAISREQDRIQVQVQTGLMTELEGQQAIVDIYREKGAVIGQLLPQMEAMAAALGPDAVARVAAIRDEFERMSMTTNLLQQQVGQVFQGAFSTALEALATRTATLREAVTGFFLDISRGFAQMASQALAQSAWKRILKVFGQESDVGEGATQLSAAAAATTAAGASIAAGAAALSGAAAALAAANGTSAAAGAAGGQAGGSGNWMGSLLSLFSNFFADGGAVSGPGTGTSDSILARLSDGEFVARAAVVKQAGALDFLNDFNARGMTAVRDWGSRFRNLNLPAFRAPAVPRFRFAEGGLALAGAGAAPQVNLRNVVAFDRDTVMQELAKSSYLEEVIVTTVMRNRETLQGGG